MKNLKIAIAFFLVYLAGDVYSQSIITVENGEEMRAEVLKDGVRPKEPADQQDLAYSPEISEVFVTKNKNEGGDIFASKEDSTSNDEQLKIEFRPFFVKYYEGSQLISRKEFVKRMESNPVAYSQYRSGKTLEIVSNVIGIPAGFVFGYSLGTWIFNGEKPNQTVLAVSGLCTGGAFALAYVGRAKIVKSVNTYNASVDLGLRLNINKNGIGLAFQF